MLGILLIFSPGSQALSLSGLKLKTALDSGHSSIPTGSDLLVPLLVQSDSLVR
jgi:hypothetical protein